MKATCFCAVSAFLLVSPFFCFGYHVLNTDVNRDTVLTSHEDHANFLSSDTGGRVNEGKQHTITKSDEEEYELQSNQEHIARRHDQERHGGQHDREDRDTSTSKSGKHRCGDERCWCSKLMADCSRHYGNLTYIPDLPNNIVFLNFSFNDLNRIEDDYFFQNVTFIQTLDLSSNNLTYISAGAFKPIKKLQQLFLDYNFDLTYDALHPVFAIDTLVWLKLRHGKLGPIPDDIFITYPMPHLKKLNLHDNYLKQVNLSAFSNLRSLRELGLSGNELSQCVMWNLRKLTTISLSDNRIYDFPDTCSEGNPILPKLEALDLKNNHIHAVPKSEDICLPKLKRLGLSGNRLPVLVSGVFGPRGFPSLQILKLEYMSRHIRQIEKHAFANPSLEVISLMFNGLTFANDESIDAGAFDGCPNLHTLQLSHNVFSGVTDQRFLQLFGNSTQLKRMYLGNADVERVSTHTFANFPLLEELSMYLNKLSEIPDGTFDANTHLTKLSINDNKISVVREATFSKVVRSSLRKLDLSGNPFVCDCGLRWFQAWFVAHRSLFGHFRKDYSCNNLPNTDVTSFYVADQACLLSQEALILIIVAVSLLLVVFITSSAVYHFRWDIRLVLYQAFRGQGDIRRRHLEEGNFRYDVFVSYDNEDLPWVETHLLPELEGRLRLRVCDHHRDFIPGKHILENIVDCVEASKKVMMLFSPSFVESPWCQFELKMCLQHVMDTDDMLVIILLEDVAPRDLTGSMRAVMNTVTYIPWSDEEEGRASFWGRIRLALHEVIE